MKPPHCNRRRLKRVKDEQTQGPLTVLAPGPLPHDRHGTAAFSFPWRVHGLCSGQSSSAPSATPHSCSPSPSAFGPGTSTSALEGLKESIRQSRAAWWPTEKVRGAECAGEREQGVACAGERKQDAGLAPSVVVGGVDEPGWRSHRARVAGAAGRGGMPGGGEEEGRATLASAAGGAAVLERGADVEEALQALTRLQRHSSRGGPPKFVGRARCDVRIHRAKSDPAIEVSE